MSQNKEAQDNRQDLAVQRTEWAYERTALANERTLVAWLRTGIAVTGFGALVPRLLSGTEPEVLVNLISVAFVLAGTAMVILGVRGYRAMTDQLTEQRVSAPWWLVASLAGTVEIGAILVLVLFILS